MAASEATPLSPGEPGRPGGVGLLFPESPCRFLGHCAGVPATQTRPTTLCGPQPQPQPARRPALRSRAPGAGALGCLPCSKRIPLDGTVAPQMPQSAGAWPLPLPFVHPKRPREAPEAFQADPAPLPVLGCWGARVSTFGDPVARSKGPGEATKAILTSGIPLHIPLGVRVPPLPMQSERGPCPLCAVAHGCPRGSSCPTHRPDLVRALRTRGTWVPSWPRTPRSGLALFTWHPGLSSALLGPPGAGSRAQAPGPLPASGQFRRSLLAWAPQLRGGGWRCGPRTRPRHWRFHPWME